MMEAHMQDVLITVVTIAAVYLAAFFIYERTIK